MQAAMELKRVLATGNHTESNTTRQKDSNSSQFLKMQLYFKIQTKI